MILLQSPACCQTSEHELIPEKSMQQQPQQPQQSQESATTSTAPRPQGATGPAVQRQFVNFAFFRLDPAFRRLTPQQQDQGRDEFVSLFAAPRDGLICLTYSTVGLKADCDFLIW